MPRQKALERQLKPEIDALGLDAFLDSIQTLRVGAAGIVVQESSQPTRRVVRQCGADVEHCLQSAATRRDPESIPWRYGDLVAIPLRG